VTDGLDELVDHGVVEKVRYSDRPERFEDRLTANETTCACRCSR
jgi:DNA-binding HxlR family transcriptional regulator